MTSDTLCFSVQGSDRSGLLRDLTTLVANVGGNIEGISLTGGREVEMHLEVSGVEDAEELRIALSQVEGISATAIYESSAAIFGKRVIVLGGGAQIAQVVLGAVSEADRHNIRGERISVDTIPLVGEGKIAEAVRAVARLPRAAILVLAGSLMGGEITTAVLELRRLSRIPVISLNMAGSVPDAADLVVTDPVQAGVMAVMSIADTAKFDLARLKNRRM